MRDTVAQPSKWNLLCPKSYQLFWKLACSWFKFAQEIYFIETEVVGCFCLDKVIRATYRLKFSGLKNWQSLNIFQPLIQNGSCSTHILHTPWLHDTLKSWINFLTGRVFERISCKQSAIFFFKAFRFLRYFIVSVTFLKYFLKSILFRWSNFSGSLRNMFSWISIFTTTYIIIFVFTFFV